MSAVALVTGGNRGIGLATALRAMAPEFDARFISRAAGRVRGRANPVRDFDTKFRPPQELLELGRQLMAPVDNADLSEVDRALSRYQCLRRL